MAPKAQPHHLALDARALRDAVDAHQRYLAGRSGGRRLSLPYADLSNCSLEGVDLREADFAGANFNGATLARANLSRAILFGSDMRDADLRLRQLRVVVRLHHHLRRQRVRIARLSCRLRQQRLQLR